LHRVENNLMIKRLKVKLLWELLKIGPRILEMSLGSGTRRWKIPPCEKIKSLRMQAKGIWKYYTTFFEVLGILLVSKGGLRWV